MNSNIIVKVSLFAVVILIALFAVKKCNSGSIDVDDATSVAGGEDISEETLTALGLEGDTAQDTVKTLIGEVRKLKVDITGLRDDNRTLRTDNESLRKMETTITRRITSEMGNSREKQERVSNERFERLRRDTTNKMENMIGRMTNRKSGPLPGSATRDASGTVWIEPLDRQNVDDGGSVPFSLVGRGPLDGSTDITGIDGLTGNSRRRNDAPQIEPVFTIAKNSTLVGSTALTALVGRVPVGSNVVDPYSFRVIIGQENLIANGFELPEVAHAVASGKAVGDWTLGCVRGVLHSITFVFKDGTIRTVPEPKDITTGGVGAQQIPIGELADNFGNPCVVGKRITNAYTYLAQRIGITAAGAAAAAAAAANTTTQTSFGGGGAGSTTVVDGSTGDYVLGKTLSDSAQEVAIWLDERQAQQFDAIYVAPGRTVSILINEEIRIDYDPIGRKIHHDKLAFGGNYRELD